MRRILLRCVVGVIGGAALAAVPSSAQEPSGAITLEAAVKSRPETLDGLPAAAKLRLTVRPAVSPQPVERFALTLPDGLKFDPRGIRRCPLTVEELAHAGTERCRRSRVGSGTLTRIAPDGTSATGRVRLLRGPGDALSVRATFSDEQSTASADIADDGFRLDLPSLTRPGYAFGGLTLALGRVHGRSLVRLRGCDDGGHAIGFVFFYPGITTPDGGGALASEAVRDLVPCGLR
jgi:hypothetical protein